MAQELSRLGAEPAAHRSAPAGTALGRSARPRLGAAPGHLVGLIFDSNIHGLVWDYRYNDNQARAVSVASDRMLEALKSIYNTQALVEELTADQP